MSDPRERYDHNANNVTGTPVDEENDLVPIQLWREQQAEIERLRAYTAAYNTLLAERVEVECLRGLAIRAWHSFRSGLTATGGCLDGLTDGDILELVRLSNTEAAKLRGHDSVAATIAEIERQAKIPKPNEREDEPIE